MYGNILLLQWWRNSEKQSKGHGKNIPQMPNHLCCVPEEGFFDPESFAGSLRAAWGEVRTRHCGTWSGRSLRLLPEAKTLGPDGSAIRLLASPNFGAVCQGEVTTPAHAFSQNMPQSENWAFSCSLQSATLYSYYWHFMFWRKTLTLLQKNKTLHI